MKYIGRNTAARRQIHMPVQDSKRSFPTRGILRRTHALTERERQKYIQNILQLFNKKISQMTDLSNSLVTELYVRWIASKRVQTCVTSLEIETHLCCCTGVVTRLTFIEVLKIKHNRQKSGYQYHPIINSSNNNNNINVKEATWCSRYEISANSANG